MLKREHYINAVRGFYDTDLIKIISGIRRCGKSVLLKQIMDEIRLKSDNIIFLNFEDSRDLEKIVDGRGLIDYVDRTKKDGLAYIFLDEVQLLPGWEIACRTLRLDNSLFITGSNSKLLDMDYTTKFSGRYVKFRIKPFIYKEILEYTKELGKECSVSDYLVWGGFPGRFLHDDLLYQRRYLEDIFESVLLNDIIVRYDIRNQVMFRQLANFIVRSNSRIYSANSIKNHLLHAFKSCSTNTVIKYVSYLKEAYMVNAMKRYSSKTGEELEYCEKIYNEDVSFNSLKWTDNRYDLTHNLENIVYNELQYMGYNLHFYDNAGKEIDFIAEDGTYKYYVQVAYSIADKKAWEREMGAFDGLDDRYRKILITTDNQDFSTGVIQHVRLKDFLLMDSLNDVPHRYEIFTPENLSLIHI